MDAAAENRFHLGPGDSISREQLAVILWRYAGRPAPPDLPLDFTDADEAGDHALDALRWAVGRGLLQGKGGKVLDPAGYATWAEVAALMMKFREQLEK